MQSGWTIQRNQSGSLPKRYAECGRPHAFDHSSILLYYIIRNDEMYKVLYIGGGVSILLYCIYDNVFPRNCVRASSISSIINNVYLSIFIVRWVWHQCSVASVALVASTRYAKRSHVTKSRSAICEHLFANRRG